jgi:hypothetical protein
MRLTSIFAIAILTLSTTAAAQDMTRSDFEAFSKAMQGRWLGEMTPIAGGTVNGEPFGGSATLKFNDDGKSYRWSGTLTLSGEPLDELQDVYRRVN